MSNENGVLTVGMRSQTMTGMSKGLMRSVISMCHHIIQNLAGAAAFEAADFNVLSPEQVRAALTTKKFGFNTCAMAYALFRIYVAIPKVQNPVMKAKAATELRQALLSKEGFEMFEALDKKIKELEGDSTEDAS